MNIYTISLFSHLMIMFCFHYILTDRQPLEMAAKNCLFDRFVYVRFSLVADLAVYQAIRFVPEAEVLIVLSSGQIK